MSIRRHAFTLIEVLIVLAIIMVLATMTMGALHVVKEAAKKKEAAVQEKALVIAIKNYKGDFYKWPGQTEASKKDVEFKDEECATVIEPLLTNPKKKIYMREIPEGSYTNGAYLDPWNESYIIVIDYDGNDEVEVKVGDFHETVYDNVAVLSIGQDPDNPDKGVFSWR